VLLALERGSGAALHEQLERRLREHVRSGRLAPGSRLPSSRALASELGVSRGVVLEAYAQLTAEGYLTATQGAPTRVAATPSAERPPVPAGSLERRFAYDFDPGLPDLATFPREQWTRSLRGALRGARFDQLGRGDPRGSPELRNALMRYLGRVRGAAPEPEHTLITSGFAQGFAMVCRALRDRGVERIALEQPGYSQHRLIAERAELQPAAVAVDESGIDVAALATTGCEVVVLTPAHQFPTGVVLSADRRAALLEWAEDRDGLIVEDDYDSEIRFDRVPVGALQGLAPERVCQIGSASKRLAPGTGLGWMLSPSWLTGDLTYDKALTDGGSPMLEQLAFAEFIASGELDRHLRRMRTRYRQRRETLVAALARSLPSARVTGVAAGLFVLAWLHDGADEDAVLSAAAARGIGAHGLGAHWIGERRPPGLVLGYGNVSEHGIADGIALLVDAVSEVRS
jgi:GntR family transcriptional regulator/MocR family aminotransferase